MRRTVFYYGLSMAALVGGLKAVEYSYLVHSLSLELYISSVATTFTAFGVWAGLRWTTRRAAPGLATAFTAPQAAPAPPTTDADADAIGISKREMEVLMLIAHGHSNQEIADTLFVSLHTVKKHTSSVFGKLEVSRRTQAVEKAKRLGLLS